MAHVQIFYSSLVFTVVQNIFSAIADGSANNVTDPRFPEELQFLLLQNLDTWEAPKEIQKGYPYYLSGFDEDNRPIWVMEFGKWDVKKAVQTGGSYLENLDKYINQWVYRMLNSTSLLSTPENPVTDLVELVDMDGYSVSQLKSYSTITFLLKKARELHFALRKVETGYIINASFIAESFVGLLRPIFGRDMEKVEILGTNRQIWVPKLLRRLPRDQISEAYGGLTSFNPGESKIIYGDDEIDLDSTGGIIFHVFVQITKEFKEWQQFTHVVYIMEAQDIEVNLCEHFLDKDKFIFNYGRLGKEYNFEARSH